MRKLLFRSCEAADGRRFAFLTDQPEVEEAFDNGYKVAYKDIDGSNNSNLLAHWKSEFTVESQPFNLIAETGEIPEEVMSGFNLMVSALIKGVDVLFCDYNLGVEGDLPMCNELMDKFRSTDFVLFSCADIVGEDPSVQPYMVSYAAPRYKTGAKIAKQHRIYCKTDNFAFCQAINAIVVQRKKDDLMGGHIRSELTPYIVEPPIDQAAAQIEVSRYVDTVRRFNGDIKALDAPNS
jgi:hypothetical protein